MSVFQSNFSLKEVSEVKKLKKAIDEQYKQFNVKKKQKLVCVRKIRVASVLVHVQEAPGFA